MTRARGFTLVELVIFIVVVAIAVSGVMLAFSASLRGAPSPQEINLGTQLARERMELILAQRQALGFACFDATRYDPCAPAQPATAQCPATGGSTQPVCAANPLPGYQVTPGLALNWNGDANFRVVTVDVQGPTGGAVAQLRALVGNY